MTLCLASWIDVHAQTQDGRTILDGKRKLRHLLTQNHQWAVDIERELAPVVPPVVKVACAVRRQTPQRWYDNSELRMCQDSVLSRVTETTT